eukprot:2131269-Rhodomonas_salina.5
MKEDDAAPCQQRFLDNIEDMQKCPQCNMKLRVSIDLSWCGEQYPASGTDANRNMKTRCARTRSLRSFFNALSNQANYDVRLLGALRETES